MAQIKQISCLLCSHGHPEDQISVILCNQLTLIINTMTRIKQISCSL